MSSSSPQYPTNPYSAQATLGPPNSPTGKPAGGGGGWKWLFIIFGIGGLGLVACCGACGGLAYFGMNAIKQMPPYQMAMTKVRESVEVNEKIGNPIEDSIVYNGLQINDKGQTGDARFDIELKGPNGTGTVAVKSTKQGGTWVLDDCTVTFADGTSKQLANAAEGEAAHAQDEAGHGDADHGEMKEDAPAEAAAPPNAP